MNKAKNKGTYWENRCASLLNRAYRKHGYEFKRVVGSGAHGKYHQDLTGDIYIVSKEYKHKYNHVEIECKRREALRTDCVIKGSAIIDGFIRKLEGDNNNSDWVLLLKTGSKQGKFYNHRPETEYMIISTDRYIKLREVRDVIENLTWHNYALPKAWLRDRYLWADFRQFLKLTPDGFKYFLLPPTDTQH